MRKINKFILKILTVLDLKPEIRSFLNIKISKTNVEFKEKKTVVFEQETIFHGKGRVEIGEDVVLGCRYGGGYRKNLIEIQPREENSEIEIGKDVVVNNGFFICCKKKISIGDGTLIGSGVTIIDHNAHGIKLSERRTTTGTAKEIKIGKNVWIGNGVFILPGTEIGENSIVGAGSVVKGKFPKDVIIMGNPAVIINKIEE